MQHCYPQLRKGLTYIKRLTEGMTKKSYLKDAWQVGLWSKKSKHLGSAEIFSIYISKFS